MAALWGSINVYFFVIWLSLDSYKRLLYWSIWITFFSPLRFRRQLEALRERHAFAMKPSLHSDPRCYCF